MAQRTGQIDTRRWLARLAAGMGFLAMTLVFVAATPVLAQPCTADAQCRDNGRPRTRCSGNSLVTLQPMCSGSCRTVEVARIPCPGACVADRCVGGPPLAAPIPPPRGGGGTVANICGAICACHGRRLTYALGFARREANCQRRTITCKYGCTCDPEARCLKADEPPSR